MNKMTEDNCRIWDQEVMTNTKGAAIVLYDGHCIVRKLGSMGSDILQHSPIVQHDLTTLALQFTDNK